MPRPTREFLVEADEDGSRLETFLRVRLGLTRPTALKALRKGWVRVDGRRAKGAHRLTAGERVRITNYGLPLPAIDGPPAARPDVPAAALSRARASVLLEDPSLVVSNKPAGQVVHRGTGHDHGWSDALAAALGATALTPVGRLDRDTSGLLVLARTRGASRKLFADLKARRLARTYTALVLGQPPASGEVAVPLERGGAAGEERMVPSETAPPAVTRFRTLERLGRASLLELTLETGRTHQIRAHLAGLGHPLLGDPRYGSDASQRLSRELGVPRLFLHAGRLTLLHPETGDALDLQAPLPPDLAAPLERLRGGKA